MRADWKRKGRETSRRTKLERATPSASTRAAFRVLRAATCAVIPPDFLDHLRWEEEAGSTFVVEMHRAAEGSARTIAVLSPVRSTLLSLGPTFCNSRRATRKRG